MPPVNVNMMSVTLPGVGLYRLTVTHTVPSHITPTRIVYTVLVVWLRVYKGVTASKEVVFYYPADEIIWLGDIDRRHL